MESTQCCALESFLLHYRNLREFFQNIESGRDADSLMASHYAQWTGDPEWRADQDEKNRLNKLLAQVRDGADPPDACFIVGNQSWAVEVT